MASDILELVGIESRKRLADLYEVDVKDVEEVLQEFQDVILDSPLCDGNEDMLHLENFFREAFGVPVDENSKVIAYDAEERKKEVAEKFAKERQAKRDTLAKAHEQMHGETNTDD